jgi:[glutamine synthetase] adenylyltransferase / [glutamine synthetase]-adenylyl-L-tyrosine phosphorylase
MDDFSRQIDFLEQHSTYARRWLSAHPEWLEWLRIQGQKKVDLQGIKTLLKDCAADQWGDEQDEALWMANLRLARQRLMLWVAFRDLNSMADLQEVTHALSHFAQLAVSNSIAFIREDLKTRFGLPWSSTTQSEMPLMVVGMGKLGGLELNLSSDIDLSMRVKLLGGLRVYLTRNGLHEWVSA